MSPLESDIQLIGPRMRLDAWMTYHRASWHQRVAGSFFVRESLNFAGPPFRHVSVQLSSPGAAISTGVRSPERRSFDLELVSQRELHYARLGDRPGILSERRRIRECAVESDGRGIETH
jgi:hypothetical protein